MSEAMRDLQERCNRGLFETMIDPTASSSSHTTGVALPTDRPLEQHLRIRAKIQEECKRVTAKSLEIRRRVDDHDKWKEANALSTATDVLDEQMKNLLIQRWPNKKEESLQPRSDEVTQLHNFFGVPPDQKDGGWGMAAVREALMRSVEEMEKSRTKNSQLQAENEKLSSNVEDLRELNQRLRSRSEELHTKKVEEEHLRAEITNLRVENEQLTSKISQLCEDNERRLTKTSELYEEIEQVGTKISELYEENERLTTKVSELYEEKKQLTAKVSELTSKNEQLVTKISERGEENKQLTTKASELSVKNEQLTHKTSKLYTEIERLSIDIDELHTAKEKCRTEIETLHKEKGGFRVQIEALSTEKERLRNRIEEIRKENKQSDIAIAEARQTARNAVENEHNNTLSECQRVFLRLLQAVEEKTEFATTDLDVLLRSVRVKQFQVSANARLVPGEWPGKFLNAETVTERHPIESSLVRMVLSTAKTMHEPADMSNDMSAEILGLNAAVHLGVLDSKPAEYVSTVFRFLEEKMRHSRGYPFAVATNILCKLVLYLPHTVLQDTLKSLNMQTRTGLLERASIQRLTRVMNAIAPVRVFLLGQKKVPFDSMSIAPPLSELFGAVVSREERVGEDRFGRWIVEVEVEDVKILILREEDAEEMVLASCNKEKEVEIWTHGLDFGHEGDDIFATYKTNGPRILWEHDETPWSRYAVKWYRAKIIHEQCLQIEEA
ncbi:MAG: hypothetical protein Q9165_001039 [Trypethelium subeluteriae]